MIRRTRRADLRGRVIAGSALVSVLLAACSGQGEPSATPETDETTTTERPDEPDEVEGTTEEPETTEEPGEATEEPADPAADAAEVGANELGEVPIIMYHRLLPDGGGDYDLTPDQFRDELRRLHEEGYVPITAAELVSGAIDIPAGASPVVLTFDDSTREQFGLTEDGEVTPDTAVGIMEELRDELDGFEPTGSFYVLRSLFGSEGERGQELLAALHDLGYEIGNHTAQHENLGQLDAAGVQRALAEGVANIEAVVPDAEVNTLSYPLGIRPDDPSLVAEGEHDGSSYAHDAGLLVGSGPAPSPHAVDFEPLAVPRIRSQPDWSEGDEIDWGSGYWLDVLASSAERRYVSDGDPDTISFPEEATERLAPAFEDRAQPY